MLLSNTTFFSVNHDQLYIYIYIPWTIEIYLFDEKFLFIKKNMILYKIIIIIIIIIII